MSKQKKQKPQPTISLDVKLDLAEKALLAVLTGSCLMLFSLFLGAFLRGLIALPKDKLLFTRPPVEQGEDLPVRQTQGMPPPAERIEITVKTDENLGPVNDMLYGVYTNYAGTVNGYPDNVVSQSGRDEQVDYSEALDLIYNYHDLLSALAPSVMTYPGGFRFEVNWRDSIGSYSERPAINYQYVNDDKIVMGTDEFVNYAKNYGAEPVFIVPVANPLITPQSAADWVEYTNGTCANNNYACQRDEYISSQGANVSAQTYYVKYWILGDEPWQLGAENYAQKIIDYAAAMRAVDPDIKIIAAGPQSASNLQNRIEWFQTVGNIAGDYFDFWNRTYYFPGYTGEQNDAHGISIKYQADIAVKHNFTQSGSYEFSVYANKIDLGNVNLALYVDGQLESTIMINKKARAYEYFFPAVNLTAGEHEIKLKAANAKLDRKLNLYHILKAVANNDADNPVAIDLKNDEEVNKLIQASGRMVEERILEEKPYWGNKKAVITHNIIYDDFMPLQHTLRESLALADVFQVLNKYSADLEFADIFELYEDSTGHLGLIEGVANDWYHAEVGERGLSDARPRPNYFVQKMFNDYYQGQKVAVNVANAPVYAVSTSALSFGRNGSVTIEDISELSVSAVRDGAKLRLFVINKTPDQKAANIQFNGDLYIPAKAAVHLLTAENLDSHNDPENCLLPFPNQTYQGYQRICTETDRSKPLAVKTETSVIDYAGNNFYHVFPGYSFTVISVGD